MSYLVKAVVLSAVVFLVGCVAPSVKTFEGERDISQIAILKGGLAGKVMSRFSAYVDLDGTRTQKRVGVNGDYPTELQVEPGRYQVVLHCNTTDSFGFPSVTAEFKAGMTYEIFCEVPQYQVRKIAAYISQSYPTASYNKAPAVAAATGLKAIGATLAGPVASLRTYAPPSGVTPATGATIRGSHTPHNPDAYPSGEQVSYVLSVGGQLAPRGKEAYSEPLLIPAGAQDVRLAWEQGNIFVQQAVRINLNAGEEYVLKHERSDKSRLRLWIEEVKTQRKVGQDIWLDTVFH